ncbi:MAG: acyl CoA:acetate/3-ketoacid CoA transferase [Prosthecobacter sp.]|uniref:acyl CoA:acetate/3-ketoacid CoA transferase n=1 Tax=Prosthecobacter sp. TaxID=1965333 RepID=UPI003900B225
MRSPALLATADEAVAAIPSGATVAVSGFVGAGHAEMLTSALERRFLQTGTPRHLTLYYCAGQGDRAERGMNHLAHRGMLKRIVGGHWNLAPKLGALALANEVEAYNLPQGVLSVLTREIAAKRPGLITKVGLNTFIDPVHGGGRLNARTTEPLVERIELDGETWLRYKPMPIHVALIRATYADARGNLSMECEGLISEVLPMAQAAKNHGGIVIAQVESVVDQLPDPKAVRVPGLLVDYIVTSAGVQHDQTFGEVFNEDFVVTGDGKFELPVMPESERKRIGTRALREIREGDIVNLGIGLPEAVAMVAAETGRLQEFTLTVESGPTGGVPASGLSFGCSHFPEAVIDQPSQFDFYDGGGLDIAVLGAVEVDAEGSVNVASFAGRFAGVGGFVNIAQSARRLVFCCTFQAKGNAKFVSKLQHVCFHGPTALKNGQQVIYVTERAVFELTPQGLRLIEIAAGLNLQCDVLDQMQFTPLLAKTIRTIP